MALICGCCMWLLSVATDRTVAPIGGSYLWLWPTVNASSDYLQLLPVFNVQCELRFAHCALRFADCLSCLSL